MQLDEIMDVDLLRWHLKEGNVVSQTHPELPLTIYNYSKLCQYQRTWDNVTLQTRGLVADGSNRIVMLPIGKFFNVAEHEAYEDELGPLPNENYSIYEKKDGSLFLARNDPEYGIVTASRGSFTSEQCQVGTELLSETRFEQIANKKSTYIFEVIYPENRIVINHGNEKALYLLAIKDTEENYDLPPGAELTWAQHLGVKAPRTFNFENNSLTALPNFISDDEEGYVIRYHESNVRAKIKGDTYIRLHRIMTQTNPKTIWEWLRDGNTIDELIEDVPDEFFEWATNVSNKLLSQYSDILVQAHTAENEARGLSTRKEQAELIKNTVYPGIAFSLLDYNDEKASDAAWKMVKPRGDEPFLEDDT